MTNVIALAIKLVNGASLLFAFFIVSAMGCAMSAPMYVWKPALNQKKAIRTIAVAPTYGNKELAEKLDQAIIGAQPKAGGSITLLHPRLLEEMTNIQLVSYDGQPSDLAGINAARRANADILLQGQILLSRTEPQEPQKGMFDFRSRPSEMVTVAWTVTDVASGERVGAHTIRLDRVRAEKEFPDLVHLQGDNMDKVVAAISRKSWSMFSPITTQDDATLALPWVMPGASLIRKGNGFAKQGRWDLAEESWQDAATKHRKNKAAWHNLAVSAVARQDFDLARRRVDHAKTILPNDRADKTERWIDHQQHEYHRAFGLGPREGGWLEPDPPEPPEPGEIFPVQPVEPVDIEDMPWWTAIPGTKPPGWTWKQWLTQPWAM